MLFCKIFLLKEKTIDIFHENACLYFSLAEPSVTSIQTCPLFNPISLQMFFFLCLSKAQRLGELFN